MMSRCAFSFLTGVLLLGGNLTASAAEPGHFTNPLREGADPWVIRDEAGQRWLWCTAPNAERIVMRTTPTLTATGTEHVIWQAPPHGARKCSGLGSGTALPCRALVFVFRGIRWPE